MIINYNSIYDSQYGVIRVIIWSTYFKFLEGNSMPEDIPVGAPVSLEFFSTIDSSVLYTHKDHRFTEYINRYYPHIIFFLYESYAIPYIEL